ncbi:hypothetical protein BDZ91DRAFT_792272 [Kalaharituber pfeilii]|nr:hypothetical protein BDZ91DRAFT_792272 [Kalaharituber pfeilii]
MPVVIEIQRLSFKDFLLNFLLALHILRVKKGVPGSKSHKSRSKMKSMKESPKNRDHRKKDTHKETCDPISRRSTHRSGHGESTKKVDETAAKDRDPIRRRSTHRSGQGESTKKVDETAAKGRDPCLSEQERKLLEKMHHKREKKAVKEAEKAVKEAEKAVKEAEKAQDKRHHIRHRHQVLEGGEKHMTSLENWNAMSPEERISAWLAGIGDEGQDPNASIGAKMQKEEYIKSTCNSMVSSASDSSEEGDNMQEPYPEPENLEEQLDNADVQKAFESLILYDNKRDMIERNGRRIIKERTEEGRYPMGGITSQGMEQFEQNAVPLIRRTLYNYRHIGQLIQTLFERQYLNHIPVLDENKPRFLAGEAVIQEHFGPGEPGEPGEPGGRSGDLSYLTDKFNSFRKSIMSEPQYDPPSWSALIMLALELKWLEELLISLGIGDARVTAFISAFLWEPTYYTFFPDEYGILYKPNPSSTNNERFPFKYTTVSDSALALRNAALARVLVQDEFKPYREVLKYVSIHYIRESTDLEKLNNFFQSYDMEKFFSPKLHQNLRGVVITEKSTVGDLIERATRSAITKNWPTTSDDMVSYCAFALTMLNLEVWLVKRIAKLRKSDETVSCPLLFKDTPPDIVKEITQIMWRSVHAAMVGDWNRRHTNAR